MSEIRFPYKPNIVKLSWSLLFLFFMSFITGYIAKADTQFLFFYKIFDISVKDEIIIYWCLSASFGLLTLLVLNSLAGALLFEREIVLSEDSIIFPKDGIRNKTITFNFREVVDVYVQAMYKQKNINIILPHKKLSIPQSNLPNKKAFDDMADFIINKVSG